MGQKAVFRVQCGGSAAGLNLALVSERTLLYSPARHGVNILPIGRV